MPMPPLEGNHDLYNLKGQLNHKVDFLSKFIPNDVKIHLISHSIGSKISLQLLKDEELSKRIAKCYLLFPTIEKILDSPNGFWVFRLLDSIFPLLRLFYYAFSYMPLIVRIYVVYFFCYLSGYPKFFLGTILKLTTPTVVDKIWFLTRDEMENVREIDDEIIRKNLHRLKFYYGTCDGWVPKENFHQLIERFPGVDAELCVQKIDHGFVISHGPTMARMVADWIYHRTFAQN